MNLNPDITNAQNKAEKLLEKFSIVRPAVPVEEIAKQLGFEVHYIPYDADLSGAILIEDNQTIIAVNSFHHINRQRFTIAHEIGHLMLHDDNDLHVDRDFKVNFRNALFSQAVDIEEIEANAFAASLLMPENMLLNEVSKIFKSGLDLSHNESNEIEDIAKTFQVSQQSLYIRLGKLGYL